MTQKIVIVGGGHAGGRLAQKLAASAQELSVALIGAEPIFPYERPPLSKGVLLGIQDMDYCAIWKPSDPAWKKIRTKLNTPVIEIDAKQRRVILQDSSTVPYEKLVIATGSRVRKISVPGNHLGGILALRTFEDATALSKRFLAARKLLVVGGGFIGLEVAAAAAQRGLSPRLVEASDRLLARIVPHDVAAKLAEVHVSHGTMFTFGTMVEEFLSDDNVNVSGALLSTGEIIECDLVVVATGVEPNTEIAKSAELEVEVGIVTDQNLQTSNPHIYACGDVAAFWHPLFNQRTRFESWQNAESHADILGDILLDKIPQPLPVPFFWSDQFDLSLQIMGLPHLGSSARDNSTDEENIIYHHYDALTKLVGVTAMGHTENIGKEVRKTRRLIQAGTRAQDMQLQSPT